MAKSKVVHPAIFTKLQGEFGSRCAWVEDGQYLFTLGNNVMNEEADEEMEELQEKFGDKLEFSIGYGDDAPNAIHIKDKALFDEKLVVKYLNTYIGRSCYDEEIDFGDDDEDDE